MHYNTKQNNNKSKHKLSKNKHKLNITLLLKMKRIDHLILLCMFDIEQSRSNYFETGRYLYPSNYSC
jgi:hypothetical protein